jgi:hypothetical protein
MRGPPLRPRFRACYQQRSPRKRDTFPNEPMPNHADMFCHPERYSLPVCTEIRHTISDPDPKHKLERHRGTKPGQL